MSDRPSPTTAPTRQALTTARSELVVIIVVLFVAAAFLMLRYVSPAPSSSSTTTLSPSETTTTLHHHTVAKSTVRVQVANGHQRSELGSWVLTGVIDSGGTRFLVSTHPLREETIVYFNPGFKWAAIQIANKIHVSVHSIKRSTVNVPCPARRATTSFVILGHNSPIGVSHACGGRCTE